MKIIIPVVNQSFVFVKLSLHCMITGAKGTLPEDKIHQIYYSGLYACCQTYLSLFLQKLFAVAVANRLRNMV